MSQTDEKKKESPWVEWWKELREDRGARAELRRCSTVSEAVFCKGFHRLKKMKGGEKPNDFQLRTLALIAVVLSHVEIDTEEDGPKSMGAAMAGPEADRPIVSDVRFRQILRTPPGSFDERLPDLVRVLRQMKRRAPVDRLAEDLQRWGDKIRRQWAVDYYERVS
ncbi:MAG TPA: type I-E CRISPR-associated protein Cse2/CasB [Vulgatibacter sp.]|nr:type I-E CRISPR-associated protein Cse2/CasB [Vulgatibacter sp.]